MHRQLLASASPAAAAGASSSAPLRLFAAKTLHLSNRVGHAVLPAWHARRAAASTSNNGGGESSSSTESRARAKHTASSSGGRTRLRRSFSQRNSRVQISLQELKSIDYENHAVRSIEDGNRELAEFVGLFLRKERYFRGDLMPEQYVRIKNALLQGLRLRDIDEDMQELGLDVPSGAAAVAALPATPSPAQRDQDDDMPASDVEDEEVTFDYDDIDVDAGMLDSSELDWYGEEEAEQDDGPQAADAADAADYDAQLDADNEQAAEDSEQEHHEQLDNAVAGDPSSVAEQFEQQCLLIRFFRLQLVRAMQHAAPGTPFSEEYLAQPSTRLLTYLHLIDYVLHADRDPRLAMFLAFLALDYDKANIEMLDINSYGNIVQALVRRKYFDQAFMFIQMAENRQLAARKESARLQQQRQEQELAAARQAAAASGDEKAELLLRLTNTPAAGAKSSKRSGRRKRNPLRSVAHVSYYVPLVAGLHEETIRLCERHDDVQLEQHEQRLIEAAVVDLQNVLEAVLTRVDKAGLERKLLSDDRVQADALRYMYHVNRFEIRRRINRRFRRLSARGVQLGSAGSLPQGFLERSGTDPDVRERVLENFVATAAAPADPSDARKQLERYQAYEALQQLEALRSGAHLLLSEHEGDFDQDGPRGDADSLLRNEYELPEVPIVLVPR